MPADGQPFSGRLVAADDDWQLAFDCRGQRRTMPAAELVYWGVCPETAQGPILVMADGGLLVADVLAADKESLTADSLPLRSEKPPELLRLPLDALAGVVFDPPADRRRRDRLLDRVARANGGSDRVVLQNGDQLTGLVAAIENDVVKLQADLGPPEIPTEAVAALVFNPDLRRRGTDTGMRAWVGLRDGSRLLATRLRLNQKAARITTSVGHTWETSAGQVIFLQPLGGRVTYLSDLRPAGYRHVPYLDLSWPYRTDRNVSGGRLRCLGRLYLKGLGVHSAARLTYTLRESYQRFEAELGIDDSTQGRGSVRFRVFVDGRQEYASGPVRGGAPPVPVSIELTGAKRLDLIVDFAERADVLDHADWLSARLVQ